MPEFVIDVVAIYKSLKISADDVEEAKEIAIMTIRDRWYDGVYAIPEIELDLTDCYCGC